MWWLVIWLVVPCMDMQLYVSKKRSFASRNLELICRFRCRGWICVHCFIWCEYRTWTSLSEWCSYGRWTVAVLERMAYQAYQAALWLVPPLIFSFCSCGFLNRIAVGVSVLHWVFDHGPPFCCQNRDAFHLSDFHLRSYSRALSKIQIVLRELPQQTQRRNV